MALAAVDVMDASDVTDVVGTDLTVVADTEDVAMTVADVVTTSQAQPPLDLKSALDQDAVDRVKPSIIHRYVTGDRIFVGDHVYNKEMNATERHAVFQIRADLNAQKEPSGWSNQEAHL